MNVLLIGMGRNLNRCIRTCYSFGVNRIYLLDCDAAKISGSLFSAKGKIEILRVDEFPIERIVAFETNGDSSIRALRRAECIAVGGESTTLRKKDFADVIKIPTANSLCLTAEAALAIGLYAYETQI